MIIIGYPAIGKTTCAKENAGYIDLESSCFWFIDLETGEKRKHENWYEIYCNIAEHLSKQGYIVFVSSHKEIRERLKHSYEFVVSCYPDKTLYKMWQDKMYRRYKTTSFPKDLAAVKGHTIENLEDMESDDFPSIVLRNMEYELDDEIRRFCRKQSVAFQGKER